MDVVEKEAFKLYRWHTPCNLIVSLKPRGGVMRCGDLDEGLQVVLVMSLSSALNCYCAKVRPYFITAKMINIISINYTVFNAL